MDCVIHPGIQAAAYCQNCGRAICRECVSASVLRTATQGMIFCPACADALQNSQPAWVPPPPGSPNPTVAAVLGLIPGVGAMYNGQFLKGLIHVVIFAVLISLSDHFGIFGLFIAAWVFYQSFEAYHTAKARRDDQPLPDPLGLNELSYTIFPGSRPPAPGAQAGAPTESGAQSQGIPTQPDATAPWPPPPSQAGIPPWSTPWQQTPYPPPPEEAGIPPAPPVTPAHWRRSEPVGALVLIVLGILFLLGQMNIFSFHILSYTWPLLLIALGVWLIIRRASDAQGGPK
jgi:TM2 domain-containing membrane protein YozV